MLDMNIFNSYLMMLSDMYAPKPLSENAIMGYYAVLQNMSNEKFVKSVKKVMSEWSYSYMPKPAHILNALVSKENLEVEAQNEWNLVIEAIEKYGRYQNVEFQNIATNGTITAITGGKWSELCSKNYEQLDWVKKDFIKLYQNYRKNPVKAKTNILIGLTDETRAVTIKSSVNDTKILKSNNLAIENKETDKEQVKRNLIVGSFKTF